MQILSLFRVSLHQGKREKIETHQDNEIIYKVFIFFCRLINTSDLFTSVGLTLTGGGTIPKMSMAVFKDANRFGRDLTLTKNLSNEFLLI